MSRMTVIVALFLLTSLVSAQASRPRLSRTQTGPTVSHQLTAGGVKTTDTAKSVSAELKSGISVTTEHRPDWSKVPKRPRLDLGELTPKWFEERGSTLNRRWSREVEMCYWATSTGDGQHVVVGPRWYDGAYGCPSDSMRLLHVPSQRVLWEKAYPIDGKYAGWVDHLIQGRRVAIFIGSHLLSDEGSDSNVVIFYDRRGNELLFLGEREYALEEGRYNEKARAWAFYRKLISKGGRYMALSLWNPEKERRIYMVDLTGMKVRRTSVLGKHAKLVGVADGGALTYEERDTWRGEARTFVKLWAEMEDVSFEP